jgi:hypothetical protein
MTGRPQQPRKGRVAILTALIAGMISTGNKLYTIGLMQEKNDLLTNGYRPPIPARMKNQRQKRKHDRQMNRFK